MQNRNERIHNSEANQDIQRQTYRDRRTLGIAS